MACYSALKGKGTLACAATWTKPEDIVLEISQAPKDKHSTNTRRPGHSDSERQQVGWWLPGAGGRGNGELVSNRYRASVWGDEKIVERDGGKTA